MSIMRGDRVVLIKEHEKMNMVGATLEVGNVTETSVVLRNPTTKVAVAAVSIDEFNTYFTKEICGWTAWTELFVAGGQSIGWYRTNGKKVQVKLHNDIRAEANCNKNDQFSLYIGVNLAVNRCHKKMITQSIEDLQNHLTMMQMESKQVDESIKFLTRQVKSKVTDNTDSQPDIQGTE